MKKIFSLVISLSLLLIASSCSKEKTPVVIISTRMGDLTLVLSDKTPKHTSNFIKNIKSGLYDSTIFHRVIKDFMVQAGDPNTKPHPMKTADNTLIPAEFAESLFHKKGALAMARYDNPAKASDPTQFYIVYGKKVTEADIEKHEYMSEKRMTENQKKVYKEVGGVPFLDNEYTVFGELIDGYSTLEKIANTPTGPGDLPTDPIRLTVRLDTLNR